MGTNHSIELQQGADDPRTKEQFNALVKHAAGARLLQQKSLTSMAQNSSMHSNFFKKDAALLNMLDPSTV